MTKSETNILESKSPEEYIDKSLRTKLSPAAKARLARLWMESSGYTKEDILRARNRHPYWKQKKMEGSADRTRRRLAAHDYSGGGTVNWTEALVTEFLGANGKDTGGKYLLKDWQLAERFGATIPSIQYMRRKLHKVQSLLGAKAPQAKVVEYLLHAESVLARGKGAVEELKTAVRARDAATRAVAAKKLKAVKKPAAKPRQLARKEERPVRLKTVAKPAKKPVSKSKAGAKKAAKPGLQKPPAARSGKLARSSR
jgi:hypothetical protein